MQHELCKVLVVEDDRDNADSVVMILQLWGHEAIAAYTAPQALSTARALDPDVVLIDIAMPHKNGFDIAKELLEICPDAKFVAITGFTQADIIRRSKEAGFADFLAKPVEPAHLKSVVETQCAAGAAP